MIRELARRWTSGRGSLIAAGVAFYCLLALLPALGAVVGFYTLVVGEPPQAPGEERILEIVPAQVHDLVEQHLATMRGASATTITLSAIAALVAALWSASAAVKHLLDALAPDGERSRLSYLHARALGLALTAGLVAFLCGAIALTTVLPRFLASDDASSTALAVLRWPILWGGMLLGAATLYRVARWRTVDRGRFLSVGALLAASTWLAGSAGFSAISAAAPRYARSYGALATAVVALIWFWLFAASLILGSIVDAVRHDGGQG